MEVVQCCVAVDQKKRELAEHGTPLFPVACYCDDLKKQMFDWHWHEELELIMVMEGTMIVSAGGKKYRISEGNGIFINGGVLHAGWEGGTPQCRLHSIVFHPRLVGGNTDSVFWKKYVQPLTVDHTLESVVLDCGDERHREIMDALERGWQAYKRGDEGFEFQVRSELSRAVFLLRQHCADRVQLPAVKTQREEERIKQMLAFVQNHYHEDVGIGDIAASAVLSVSECLRCFHNTIGTTPMQYVRQYRLARAAALLIVSDGKISDIALQCGFQEMSYFAKTFKQKYGCTPSQYRAGGETYGISGSRAAAEAI